MSVVTKMHGIRSNLTVFALARELREIIELADETSGRVRQLEKQLNQRKANPRNPKPKDEVALKGEGRIPPAARLAVRQARAEAMEKAAEVLDIRKEVAAVQKDLARTKSKRRSERAGTDEKGKSKTLLKQLRESEADLRELRESHKDQTDRIALQLEDKRSLGAELSRVRGENLQLMRQMEKLTSVCEGRAAEVREAADNMQQYRQETTALKGDLKSLRISKNSGKRPARQFVPDEADLVLMSTSSKDMKSLSPQSRKGGPRSTVQLEYNRIGYDKQSTT